MLTRRPHLVSRSYGMLRGIWPKDTIFWVGAESQIRTGVSYSDPDYKSGAINRYAISAKKTLRLYVMMLGLLLDYLFPSYPRTFDSYPNNAGYLSKPLFKLLLFDYSRFTLSVQTCGLINLCRGYKFFERIIFDLRSLMALDNPILCRHLSSATGKHFCFNF
jgi:hypothetical protein